MTRSSRSGQARQGAARPRRVRQVSSRTRMRASHGPVEAPELPALPPPASRARDVSCPPMWVVGPMWVRGRAATLAGGETAQVCRRICVSLLRRRV